MRQKNTIKTPACVPVLGCFTCRIFLLDVSFRGRGLQPNLYILCIYNFYRVLFFALLFSLGVFVVYYFIRPDSHILQYAPHPNNMYEYLKKYL